ncbi:MAG: TetR family transcriptional regulator C-terminal domain-containing protein [Nocardioides sp.]|uniref:TetR/AcrR family transcriptional regulator n=1 Tax=Nocardioides sp. TaxID=35761 RepID=UPI0039E34CBA
MTSARTSRKSPSERTAEIHTAARRLALESGLSALTLRSVAAEAGVTPALVAHYTETMDALVAETFSWLTGQELAEVSARVLAQTSATRRLTALCSLLLDGERNEITLIWVEGWALGHHNQQLSAAVRDQMELWQRLVAAVIEEGVASGEFHTPSPALAAWQLIGMIDGLNAQALVAHPDGGPRGSLIGSAVEGMLQMTPGALTDLRSAASAYAVRDADS